MKVLSCRNYVVVLHLCMRAAALLARFCLSIFMAKYMDIESIGMFGLIIGVANIMPRAVGLGIPYFFWREVVSLSIADSARYLRDWIALTTIIFMLICIILCGAIAAKIVSPPSNMILIVSIVFMEAIACNVNIALLACKMPMLANVIVFIRTALWVVPFIIASYLIPQLRSLTFVMEMWSIGLLLSYLILFWRLRSLDWRAILSARIDWCRLRSRIAAGPLVYLSDMSIVGATFLNRFILGATTNLEQVGVFVFYWTFANAVLNLVQTSTLQVAAPYLIEAKKGELFDKLKGLAVRSGALAVCLGIIAFGAASWIVEVMGRVELQGYADLFIFTLTAMMVQIFVEILSYGLYARRQDTAYAKVHLCDVIISAGTTYCGVIVFGLDGVAYAMLLTALCGMGIRWYFLCRMRVATVETLTTMSRL